MQLFSSSVFYNIAPQLSLRPGYTRRIPMRIMEALPPACIAPTNYMERNVPPLHQHRNHFEEKLFCTI